MMFASKNKVHSHFYPTLGYKKSPKFSSITLFTDYLTRAPWAASSQGMQDDPGAKSANCLCGYVAELSTSFSILFYQRCTSLRQVGFLCAAAQRSKLQNEKNFSHLEQIVVERVSNEWIASNL